jgi:lysine 6-dehydrogenase
VGHAYLVIGGGMQGHTAARDLAGRSDTDRVTVADAVPARGGPSAEKVEHLHLDAVANPAAVTKAARAASACVVALPGSIAQRALPAVVAGGSPVVDMSFTPEVKDRALHRAAMDAVCTLVRDVGVAPGLSHLLAADAAARLAGLDSLTIYVGGVPQRPPVDPFRHAVYFNPLDLISEYTRPARMRTGGKDRAPDPLRPREREKLEDPVLGDLEAFPSDGLRTLLESYPKCPDMREMTLRWPGHLDHMAVLAAEGRLAEGRAKATAADLSTRFAGERFPDYLLMEVHAESGGRRLASRVLATSSGGLTAMSRTTAFTATAAAHALAAGTFKQPGLHPPEVMGTNARFKELVLKDLAERGVVVEPEARLRPR